MFTIPTKMEMNKKIRMERGIKKCMPIKGAERNNALGWNVIC